MSDCEEKIDDNQKLPPRNPEMDKPLIRQIGRYQVLDLIGQGGMGVVYRGLDTDIDRPVAIKMMHGTYAEDKDSLARFYREARATANLQHKNIVTVYALDNFEGFPYMVMEFLEGRSIADLISSRAPLHFVEKLGLVCQVCEGLQYAHERSIVHRDIKPANVIVLKNGVAKIVDFGIARGGRSETLTQTGQIIGSIHYMSPEQISGSQVDGRTDIYSAGVMLYEFLTGELPFKAADGDTHATLLKILNDPVPSVSKKLPNCPNGLEELLAKAMAKNVEVRFQTAEDFGYELSRLQETIKEGMTQEYLSQAKSAMARKDWDFARQQLQEVLRFERRNPQANELLQIVREEIQRQQKSAQIGQLKSQAQIALTGLHYEEALECIEQARRLDPNDSKLIALSDSIKTQVERARELSDALRRGQAALYAGDLNEAEGAVNRALELDESHTEARALETLIKKEVAERKRRSQLQGFVEEARREISSHNFLSALHSLQKAQAIDPTDSNIRELLNWAARGHEQEKQRQELQRTVDQVGKLIGEANFSEALEVCKESLVRYPEDQSLLKLRELAEYQVALLERKKEVEDICSAVRRMIDEDRSDEAIAVLDDALKTFPGEQTLETLSAIAHSERERKNIERDEQQRRIRAISDDGISADSRIRDRQEMLLSVSALRSGLTKKLPLKQLEEIAHRLEQFLTSAAISSDVAADISQALSEFHKRLEKWTKDSEELRQIEQSLSSTKNIPLVDTLVDRARLLVSQYESDEAIANGWEKIKLTAAGIKTERDAIASQAIELLRRIQTQSDLEANAVIERNMRAVCLSWRDDALIISLVNQAAGLVKDLQDRKEQVLCDLVELGKSIEGARSAGQVRLMRDQARMLAAEIDHSDVQNALANLERGSEEKLQELSLVASELRKLMTEIETASSLSEVEKYVIAASDLQTKSGSTEETAELIAIIERTVNGRRRDHARIENNLNQLVASAEKATGQAELDLILARARDLLKRYAGDHQLLELAKRLESTVIQHRELLSKSTTESHPTEELDNATEDLGPEIGSVPSGSRSKAVDGLSKTPKTVRPGSRRIVIFVSAAACVLTLTAAGLYFFTRRSATIGTVPSDATAKVLSPLPPTTATPSIGSPNVPVSDHPKVVIRTSVPGASIFMDGSQSAIGKTDINGQFQFPTTAGPHQIRVEKTGFENSPAQMITAKSGDVSVALFDLRRSPGMPEQLSSAIQTKAATPVETSSPAPVMAPPPVVETFLTVQAPVGAEIHIDQQLAGHSTGTPLKTKVQPGQRTVDVFLSGFQPYSQTVNLSPGEQVNVSARLNPVPAATPSIPPPSVAHGPSGVSDEDRKEIQGLLDRYAEGYRQKNIKAIQALWPSIPSDTAKKIKDFFKMSKSVDMQISLSSATPADKRVVVSCTQTLRYSLDGKEGTHTETKTLYVVKNNSEWIIDFIPNS